MDNRLLYQSASIGGLVSALMDTIPYLNLINCFCCIGIALGGVVSLFYYRSKSPSEPEEFTMPGLVHIGLLTGLIGAVVSFILHYFVYTIIGNWEIEVIKNLMENLDELPAMWDQLYADMEDGKYDGFAGPMILVRSLILFPIFTFIGTLIGNKFVNRGKTNLEA